MGRWEVLLGLLGGTEWVESVGSWSHFSSDPMVCKGSVGGVLLWTVDGVAVSGDCSCGVWALSIDMELSCAWLTDSNWKSPNCSELFLWAKEAKGYEFQQLKPLGE